MIHAVAARAPRGPCSGTATGGTRDPQVSKRLGQGQASASLAVPNPFPTLCGVNSKSQRGSPSLRTQGQKKHMAESGHGDMAGSRTNSLLSRVIWAVSGVGSAPRHPALRTALPPLQYRLHVRHIASGCSHRGLSHRIASRPIASRSGCCAALLPAAASTGGGCGPGGTRQAA